MQTNDKFNIYYDNIVAAGFAPKIRQEYVIRPAH